MRRSPLLLAAVLGVSTALGACADDAPTTQVTTPADPPATVEVPPGILAAVPFQHRQDVVTGTFEVKLINHGPDVIEMAGFQFRWTGFTTDVVRRTYRIGVGQSTDFPVAFPGAVCRGDGTEDDMPDVATATVRLLLADGSERTVPVFDRDGRARRLYLDDCERQRIEATVGIEWRELHEEQLDGRPVTAGFLVATRRAAGPAITVESISNTINFSFEAAGASPGGPLLVLAAGDQEAQVPVHVLEGRCDSHAMGESSQPFGFLAQVDLGDGVLRPYATGPAVADRGRMLRTYQAACAQLGLLHPLDQPDG